MELTRAFPVMHFIILISFVVCVCNHPALSQSPMGAQCMQQTCGNLKLSYPFKLQSEPNCPSFSSFFDLECKGEELYLHNFTQIQRGGLIVDLPMRVLQIHRDSLLVDATPLSAVMTRSEDGNCSKGDSTSLLLPDFPGPFVLADDNLFGSFGCSMVVVLGKKMLKNMSTSESLVEVGGCSVLCPGNENKPGCGGRTCCISSLDRATSFREAFYLVDRSPFITNTAEFNSSPCNNNYATLFDPKFSNQSYGLKLNWALPSNQTNSTMDIKSSSTFACSNHSDITIVPEVPGYRCSCQLGFDGDGYSLGSSCSGDGLRKGNGCSFSPTLRNGIAFIGEIVFLGLMIAGLVSFVIYRRRKIKKRYFLVNGGIQLQEIIRKPGGKESMKSRIFKVEELKAATDNYADHMKIGMGGFGTMYKGVLADGSIVAITKSNKVEEGRNDEFLNEMQILMQINHKNIVRLLGCCMETNAPFLVYEFVANGSVRENLDLGNPNFMIWVHRLKVACQIAEALAYLHAITSPPILHLDVKSTNVLLDDNLDAKVVGFSSYWLALDGVQNMSMGMQGTIGYLDPKYFQTLQLNTDKSDVYNLGVILVELITGLNPIDIQSHKSGFANLALLFINHMQEARVVDLIDSRLADPSTQPIKESWDLDMVHSSIMAVADLAWRCLASDGADHPPMSLIIDELYHITRSLKDIDNELDGK